MSVVRSSLHKLMSIETLEAFLNCAQNSTLIDLDCLVHLEPKGLDKAVSTKN
jgi:hypothetical protein